MPADASGVRLSKGPTIFLVGLIAILLSFSGTAFAKDPTFSKTANPSSGMAPLNVVYTYTLDNTQGTQLFFGIDTPSDDKCMPVTFSGGDSNHNQSLDIGEIWTWTCRTVLNVTTVNTSQTSMKFSSCPGGVCSTGILDFITTHATVTIVPPPAPSVTIGGNKSVCKNDPAALTALASMGTPPYTFLWSTGATTQTISPSTAVAGMFPFNVTVTDHAGQTASANTTFRVIDPCVVTINTKNPPKPPDLPLLTTIQWGCGWSFAGRCLSQTITQVCIGGNCFDNPTSPDPPLCPKCVGFGALGIGAIAGLAVGLLLRRGGGQTIEPGAGPPFPSEPR